ncbi:MAG TPA: aldo/keto reductase [Candidatus Binatia bacterium]|jgi:voltage-dependent potassium channel beta subunit|nr:aldo/keto reductase [Candidatus Binatia bacterium]
MQYRRLGKSGLKVSALSFGSWVTFSTQLDVGDAKEAMAAARDYGVNFFDNAEAYANGESERIMGKALKELQWPRDSYVVSSKVFWGAVEEPAPTQQGLSRKHVTEACHQALRRLQTDYLDLYFCHRPDIETPIEETVRSMTDLVRQGKVLYWGTSEWTARQLTEAFEVAYRYSLEPPTMEQPEYNMLHRERVEVEYHPLYARYGLGTTIWSPLASGFLTGKYNNGIPEDSRVNLDGYEWLRKRLTSEEGQRMLQKVGELADVARDLDTTMPRLAIAWCLLNPNVSTVITGASKVSQIHDNMQSVETLAKLTPEVQERIEGILDNKPELPESYL